jgi:hypothetical protein
MIPLQVPLKDGRGVVFDAIAPHPDNPKLGALRPLLLAGADEYRNRLMELLGVPIPESRRRGNMVGIAPALRARQLERGRTGLMT